MNKEDYKLEESPVIQEMDRETDKVKKCCNIMKEDVHIICKCCAYTWCFSLNSIECCCLSMSKCSLFMSNVFIGCNNFLEQIDCDKH